MTNTNKPSALFWIIGVVALLWNGMGVNYYLQSAFKTEASTAGLNEAQIELMDSMPAWYTALFAIAVFSGIIGSIALLMKKKIAVPIFMISFVAAFINQIYWLFATDAVEVFSDQMPYLMPALVVLIGAFLIWYSKKQKAKHVLS
jgi:hypothetical protein